MLAIARKADKDKGSKADKGGNGEKVLSVIEGAIALLNIGLHTAVNAAELVEEWNDKDEEQTVYQI